MQRAKRLVRGDSQRTRANARHGIDGLHHIVNGDFFGRAGKLESAAQTALRRNDSGARELLEYFGKVVHRDLRVGGDLGNGLRKLAVMQLALAKCTTARKAYSAVWEISGIAHSLIYRAACEPEYSAWLLQQMIEHFRSEDFAVQVRTRCTGVH